MAILQSTMTDESATQPKRIGEACAGGVAVQIAFFHPNEAVLAFARGLKTEQLLDDEVLRPHFEACAAERASVAIGWFEFHEGSAYLEFDDEARKVVAADSRLAHNNS